ncbi:MAG: DUF697 domain-containing protein [Gammaproteobacteria bacterium]|nr:DUF697 domain-containing protein [Gammaproteobacteria bacterium]DAC82004.1 TPA_exp: MycS [uncultured Gammaproteobacteria bacterium]
MSIENAENVAEDTVQHKTKATRARKKTASKATSAKTERVSRKAGSAPKKKKVGNQKTKSAQPDSNSTRVAAENAATPSTEIIMNQPESENTEAQEAKTNASSTAESTESGTDVTHSRREEADRIVSKYTGWGAGSGAVPIPVLDVATIAGVQIKLIRDLMELYGTEFSETKARSIVTVLIGSISPPMLAGFTVLTLIKFLPGLGQLAGSIAQPIFASAVTYAVGRTMVGHLEEGGTISDFETRENKSRFRSSFKEGVTKFKGVFKRKAKDVSETAEGNNAQESAEPATA